MTQQLGKYL